jgi:hypothetical protein
MLALLSAPLVRAEEKPEAPTPIEGRAKELFAANVDRIRIPEKVDVKKVVAYLKESAKELGVNFVSYKVQPFEPMGDYTQVPLLIKFTCTNAEMVRYLDKFGKAPVLLNMAGVKSKQPMKAKAGAVPVVDWEVRLIALQMSKK